METSWLSGVTPAVETWVRNRGAADTRAGDRQINGCDQPATALSFVGCSGSDFVEPGRENRRSISGPWAEVQKLTFSMNWISLGSLAVVLVPNRDPAARLVVGKPKIGWLRILKNSARKSKLNLSALPSRFPSM